MKNSIFLLMILAVTPFLYHHLRYIIILLLLMILCDDTRMVTYKSSGAEMYNAMMDCEDNFYDCVIIKSTNYNLYIGFELSFPTSGI